MSHTTKKRNETHKVVVIVNNMKLMSKDYANFVKIQCLFRARVRKYIKHCRPITNSIPCSVVVKHVRCIKVEQMSQCEIGGMPARQQDSKQARVH